MKTVQAVADTLDFTYLLEADRKDLARKILRTAARTLSKDAMCEIWYAGQKYKFGCAEPTEMRAELEQQLLND